LSSAIEKNEAAKMHFIFGMMIEMHQSIKPVFFTGAEFCLLHQI